MNNLVTRLSSAHFLQLNPAAKSSTDFNKNNLFSNDKKTRKNIPSVLWQSYILLCFDWTVKVQLSLQWKAEQKTKIFKSIFQVRRWTNSRIKSSSERSHMHRSHLSKSALRPAIIKGPWIAVFASIIALLLCSWLVTSCTKFHRKPTLDSFTKESPKVYF